MDYFWGCLGGPLFLMGFNLQYSFQPIGIIHSCFKDKFGVPRQPGLVKGARGELELFPPYDRAEAVVGLESFSHLWITFVFHLSIEDEMRLSVRPPRLGGNRKMGVFATRSTHRPNPIGLSVVALEGIRQHEGRTRLLLSGLDLVEGTPVLDIKPYLPYVDAVADARAGYAQESPLVSLRLSFTERAREECLRYEQKWPGLAALIEAVLCLDPRPAYKRDAEPERVFGVRLYDLDVRWRVLEEGQAEVVELRLPP